MYWQMILLLLHQQRILYFPLDICDISLKCHTESKLHAFPENYAVHTPLPIFAYHMISIHYNLPP